MVLSDIIIIAIFAYYIYKGVRHGFFMALSNFVSSIIAFFVAMPLAKAIAPSVSKVVIYPMFGRMIEKSVQNQYLREFNASVFDSFESLSDSILQLLSSIGIKTPTQLLEFGDPVEVVTHAVAKGLSDSLSYAVSFVALFMIVGTAITFLAKTLELLSRALFLGRINTLLGGVLGFGTALTVCCLLVWGSSHLPVSLLKEFDLLTSSSIEKSIITKHIVAITPEKFLNFILGIKDGLIETATEIKDKASQKA